MWSIFSVIIGSTKSAVSAAGRRINLIVMSARQKQQFTHFLSIPMVGDSIKKRFMNFKVSAIYVCGRRMRFMLGTQRIQSAVAHHM
jgi:hypothetical protein